MQERPRASAVAFRLKDLRVDPALGQVAGPAGCIRLEPRVMAVLEMLAQRPGELVTRTDLLSAIWPGGEVYDDALTQCVYQLRQQLLSAGGNDCHKLITTVPKRGYLLNADVRPVEAGRDKAKMPPAPRRRRFLLLGMLATLMVLGMAWGQLEWRRGMDSIPASAPMRSVAVLPFLPLAELDRDPVLELGMADTLITRLSGIRQVVVRPISSVRWFDDLDRDALASGRALGVDAVVDGTIQRSGEGVRVIVRLLRVADGTALWAGTFNQRFSDIFALQDDICNRIAAALAVQLDPGERAALARPGTSNAEAYGHYLRGRYHLARLTPRDLQNSIAYFRKAVSLDPVYAQAWLGLASAGFRIPIAGEVPPKDFYPLARLAAQKALEIDPELAEGYAMLGWIAHWYDWDWAASEAYFKRAIAMNPNDTESHLGFAHLLSDTGRPAQALVEVRRARELSPLYLAAAALEGSFLLGAGQNAEALQRLEEARQLDEKFWLVRISLAGAYLAAGRNDDALAEVRIASDVSGGSTWARANEVGILGRLGRQAEAEALLAALLQQSTERYVPPYDLATAHRNLGDADGALMWLERAYEARDPKMALLGVSGWQNLRDRPEFVELMTRMRLGELFE